MGAAEFVRSGTAIGKKDPWPEQGVGFRVRRGRFTLARGEREANPQSFASRMPPAEMGSKLVLTIRPEGGEEVITWYLVRVVAA